MTFHPAHIEIDGGIVSKAATTNHRGTRPDFTDVGTFMFYVDLVAADGGRFSIWSGLDYADAIRQAEALRRDFGIEDPVRDTIAGSH